MLVPLSMFWKNVVNEHDNTRMKARWDLNIKMLTKKLKTWAC